MDDGQQSAHGAEANRSISSFLVPSRILQHEEGIIEDGYRFLEGNAVLAFILSGFQFVPAESRFV